MNIDKTIIKLILLKDINQPGKSIELNLKTSIKITDLKALLKNNSDIQISLDILTIFMFYDGGYIPIHDTKTFYFIISQNHVNNLPNLIMTRTKETYKSIFQFNKPAMEPYPKESKIYSFRKRNLLYFMQRKLKR
jgi:hypothetical protein